MNKYIKAFNSSVSGFFKFLGLKITRGSKVKMSLPALVPASCELDVRKGGSLIIGKRIHALPNGRIAVRNGGKVTIGDNFYMNSGCIITAHESVIIGNDVEFGPYVCVYDQDHDFRAEGGLKSKKFKTAPVVIGNNVWIGANTIILRGTEIGDNSVIGAGSVIKGKYPAGSVVVQKRNEEVLKVE